MSSKSVALSKALSALDHHFPTLILPTPSPAESFLSYLENLTAQLMPSKNIHSAIEKMKGATDAQQYRIQRSLLQSQNQQSFTYMEQLCYQAHSTGIIPERDAFNVKSEADGASIVDEIWWNAEKKIESIEYFMD